MTDERKVVSLDEYKHRRALRDAQGLQEPFNAPVPNYTGPFEGQINQNLRRIVADLMELADLGERAARIDPKNSTSLRTQLIGLVILAQDVFTGLPFDGGMLDPSS